jgi:ribosomal protein S18 acetylase RimI-like enzyme
MNDSILLLRLPTLNDTTQLEELFLFTLQQTFRLRPQDEFKMGDYIKSVARDEVLVAEINGKIVGFVSFQIESNFIHNLFVHPDSQNKMIGSTLLKAAEEKIPIPVTLKVAIDNAKVVGFYEKHGYKRELINLEAPKPYMSYKKYEAPSYNSLS